MFRASLALAGTTAVVATIDVVHKAGTQAAYFHARSAIYVVVVLGLAAVWTGAILATGSLSMAVGGGVLAGGALGNLADRVRTDAVTDFIDPPLWPAFNLADVAITLGAIGLVLISLGLDGQGDRPAGP